MPLFLHSKGRNTSSNNWFTEMQRVIPVVQRYKPKTELFQCVWLYSDALAELVEIPANPASHQAQSESTGKSMIEFDIPLMHGRLARRPKPHHYTGRWPEFLLSSQRNCQTQTATLDALQEMMTLPLQ